MGLFFRTFVVLLVQDSIAAIAADVNVEIDWSSKVAHTRTAATIEVDVMPFLGRTDYGGPFNGYYEAMSHLGAQYVRYAPWFANPRVVVPELSPPQCNQTHPSTNWNSSALDAIVRDFMVAVCGTGAVTGACDGSSVVQQLSTMPGWMYVNGVSEDELPENVWNTTDPFTLYTRGKALVDPTCGQMARYMARLVGWYTNGGFHDECGHWHASGFRYAWWGLSVLNEDEHHIQPDNGAAYTRCYDAIAAAVTAVNPTVTLVGPEIAGNLEYLLYFLNGTNHADGRPPGVSSFHQAMTASNDTAETFFLQWDKIMLTYIGPVESFKKKIGSGTKMVLNEYIPFVNDWCDCLNVEHLCGGKRFGPCPDWQDPKTSGGDPNLQNAKGVGMNKATWSWHASAAVFAYGYAKLAELDYLYVGQDQLVGGTWPDNEPSVSCLDWQTGQPNAKYWVTHLLATTVGDSQEKAIVDSKLTITTATQSATAPGELLHVMPYIKHGKKGILLVNKKATSLQVHFGDVTGGIATVLEAGSLGPEVAMDPPVVRRLAKEEGHTTTRSSLHLGPFAVAVVTDITL